MIEAGTEAEAGAAGKDLARAALALVGCRFRLRGRDPPTGIDCIGVLALALRATGRPGAVPCDYRMRMRDLSRMWVWAAANGFRAVNGEVLPGDVVVFAVGPEQVHLGIAVGDGGFVHAHAGLQRVVRAAVPEAWTVIGQWRLVDSVPGLAREELAWRRWYSD